MSTKSHTILIAFVLPGDKGEWTEVEADDIADGFRDIINEEWERNGASRPGYYAPCEISGIPAPQWVTAESLRTLRAAPEMESALRGVRAHLVELQWRELPDVDLAIARIDAALGVGPPSSGGNGFDASRTTGDD